jgi:hypothetical protein
VLHQGCRPSDTSHTCSSSSSSKSSSKRGSRVASVQEVQPPCVVYAQKCLLVHGRNAACNSAAHQPGIAGRPSYF